MADLIIVIILLVIIGAAVFYIVKSKKNGAKCIGCPAGANCPSKNGGNSGCSCGCQSDTKAEK